MKSLIGVVRGSGCSYRLADPPEQPNSYVMQSPSATADSAELDAATGRAPSLRLRCVRAGLELLASALSALRARPRSRPPWRSRSSLSCQTLTYGPHASHQYDLLLPSTGSLRTPIVMIHGGGFRVLSRRTHRPLARPFVLAGHPVALLDYRLSPEYAAPAAAQDVLRALRCLAERHAELGFEQAVWCGDSAGANLALVVAAALAQPALAPELNTAGAPRPRALMLVQPFLELVGSGRPELPDWMAKRIDTIGADYLAGGAVSPLLSDPLAVIAKEQPPLPPTLVLTGDVDPIRGDGQRLSALLAKKVEFHELEGAPHGFQALPWRPAAKRAFRLQLRFLRRVGPNAGACLDRGPFSQSSLPSL